MYLNVGRWGKLAGVLLGFCLVLLFVVVFKEHHPLSCQDPKLSRLNLRNQMLSTSVALPVDHLTQLQPAKEKARP